jgi:hypothetical protein
MNESNLPMPTFAKEELGWFDRLFRRTRTVVLGQGSETWQQTQEHTGHVLSRFERDYIDYGRVNRQTGEVETVWREYLN